MQYEFLKQFPRRMKHVGMYSTLIQNSLQKQIWKNYGFIKSDEQLNMIFSLLLYIMEQSLKEENCTLDDIGAYIDYVNTTYFMKNISYDDCKKIGDFIVNVVLSNEGKTMYFDGYDFEHKAYKIMNISYIANRIVYVDSDVKRTSYYLTDDGYNLLLSTLEIENNMKLTIHEMIFKLHLEKQSYDKAVDEVKNIFNLLRIQLQKIQEAMLKVRRNALNYSVADYKVLLEENMDTIEATKQKFKNYRDTVKKRATELEDENINVKKLSAEDEEKLNNLKTIENYLSKGIDEHQKILNSHFDLKILYEKELDLLSQMSLIQRFSIRNDLYDKVLENAAVLEDIDIFLRPLFYQSPDKIYNLNKSMELQKPIRKRKVDDETEVIDFDEEEWQEELIRRQKEKLKKYEKSLGCVIRCVCENEHITLREMKKKISDNIIELNELIPTVDIFKEIMIELIKSREIDIVQIRREKREYISEQSLDFQLNEMLLSIIDEKKLNISKIYISRLDDKEAVEFDNATDADGDMRTIRCSNIEIAVEN